MENATKALLIAASVLIAIVLIAVSIKILSSTSGVTNQVGTVSDTMSASLFNSQFTAYFDNSTTGTQTKALISKIMSNNSTSSHTVYLNYMVNGSNVAVHQHKSSGLQQIYNKISNNSRYKIRLSSACNSLSSGGYVDGYIACITIEAL